MRVICGATHKALVYMQDMLPSRLLKTRFQPANQMTVRFIYVIIPEYIRQIGMPTPFTPNTGKLNVQQISTG